MKRGEIGWIIPLKKWAGETMLLACLETEIQKESEVDPCQAPVDIAIKPKKQISHLARTAGIRDDRPDGLRVEVDVRSRRGGAAGIESRAMFDSLEPQSRTLTNHSSFRRENECGFRGRVGAFAT